MENVSQFITNDADVRFGKPCIKGTRIAVSDVLGWLASGMTEKEILEDYPCLSTEQVWAAIAYNL